MKKIILFSLVLISSYISQAQHVYFKLAGGYSWPGLINTSSLKGFQPGESSEPTSATITEMMNIVDTGTTNRSYKLVHGSYGKGANIGLSVGYMFNKWIGIEMNMVYLFGSKINSTQTTDASNLLGPAATTRISTSASGLSLLPALNIVAAVDGWKVHPYARLGLSIPVFGSIKHTINIDAPNPNSLFFPTAKSLRSHVEVSTDSKFSLGFVGAVGVNYEVYKNLKIWGEMNIQVLDVRAKKTTVKDFSITQTDATGTESVLTTLADFKHVYSKEVVYVDELNENSNNSNYNTNSFPGGLNYNQDKPKEELRPTAPFNNIGFSIGITFLINTKKKAN